MSLDANLIQQLKNELEAAGHGNKQGIYNRYAESLQVSRATLQRELRRRFGKQKSVEREQRIPQELIDRIADMKTEGFLLTKGGGVERELSTERCIQILQDQGVPGAELLTKTSANRRLEESGFRRRKIPVRVEVPYANFEWQMDFSRSKYFQVHGFDQERNDYILRVSGKELHYKQDNNRLRTWLAAVKDSYSRIRDVQAFAAAGESAMIGMEML